jgi:uncharacterized protein YndB with AHSA1/START domain
MAREYVFVDEWDVDAPPAAVYAVLVDARTYPEWWKPVYRSVEGDRTRTQHSFKGKLPYTLRMDAQLVSEDPPRRFEVAVDGDLRGRAVWTFTPRNGGTRVRWDWIVFADKAEAALSLEPQLGGRAGARGTRAVRALAYVVSGRHVRSSARGRVADLRELPRDL